ncbi:MAG: hypothetical protein ACJA0Q_001300 [Saprospiraceae bacterium]|jgi:hypothetical protein
MKRLKIFTLFILLATASYSQGNGTTFKSIDKCYNKTFSVSIHILEDTLGQQNVSAASIASGIALANSYFSNICATFNICSTYVHPNVRNDKVRKGIEDKEIAVMYDVPNTINIYYVIDISGASSTCGFAPLGGMTVPTKTSDRDAIFIKKSCAAGKTLTHELGHYFGLYHTFEQSTNGIEFVNGTNCATTGDLICDTPADPSGTGQVDAANCDLNPAATDPNGDYYTPNSCNIMSYYNNNCGNGIQFTTGQYDRMLEVMEKGRNYLW